MYMASIYVTDMRYLLRGLGRSPGNATHAWIQRDIQHLSVPMLLNGLKSDLFQRMNSARDIQSQADHKPPNPS
jgi:hypothetical protein